jgi:UDP-glucose 4-epimerase
MKTVLITGCCGFIGSNLTLRLLQSNIRIIGVSRFQPMHEKILQELNEYNNFKFYDIDLSKPNSLNEIVESDIEMVFHLAANADVRFSSVYPDKDINDGILATYNVLRWIKQREIKKIAYSSTSAVYGDSEIIPTPENSSFIQTSFYGAAKLAGEGLVQAHCAAYDTQSWIFRYSSITGPRYSHGFIYNFYSMLKKNPNELYVHGGKDQRKTYLDVDDCIDAMLTIVSNTNNPVNIFNIGNTTTCSLTESIPIIINYMKINPEITWSGNEVGWIGDSKINYLDVSRLISLGWNPKYSIPETIVRTLDWLENNQWILDVREEI